MGENPNKDITISDYVICTLISWHAQYDKEAMKNTAIDCFGENEFATAMNTFCYNESIVDAVVPESRHRKKDKCFDAIYKQIVSLDTKGSMPNIIVECKDLHKVPRRLPGERADDPTLDRIGFLESTVSRIVSQNEKILSEIVDFKKNPNVNQGNMPSFREIVAEQATRPVQPAALQQQDKVPTTQARNHINHTGEKPYPVNAASAANRNHNGVQLSANMDGVGASNTNEEWQSANRRRRIRPKAVQGTYTSSGANAARWAAAPRNIFVYHTDKNASEEDINAIIQETSNVEVLEVEKKSHAEAYHGSFRVSVRRNDFEKAILPQNWPAGWSVREYFHPRPKRHVQVDNNNETAAVP
jgi:hypothetical protein